MSDTQGVDFRPTELAAVAIATIFYLCLFALAIFAGETWWQLMTSFVEMQSEYTLGELLSRVYLLLAIVVACIAYREACGDTEIKKSIAMLILGVAIYLGESNILTERLQPVIGALAFVSAFWFLCQSGSYIAAAITVGATGLIALGALADLHHDSELARRYIPQSLVWIISIGSEETFELAGVMCVALASIFAFREVVANSLNHSAAICLLAVLSCGLIAIGNGFIHFQYKPSEVLYVLALLAASIGVAGLSVAYKRLKGEEGSFPNVRQDWFYVFVYFMLLLLPAVYRSHRHSTSLLLWVPTILLAAACLYLYHPRIGRNVTAG